MHIHFFLSSDNMESEQLYFRDDSPSRSSSYSWTLMLSRVHTYIKYNNNHTYIEDGCIILVTNTTFYAHANRSYYFLIGIVHVQGSELRKQT